MGQAIEPGIFIAANCTVMKQPTLLDRIQSNFFAGLAIIFPAAVSIAVVVWLFGTVSNLTDTLLIFFPKSLTHADDGSGPMYWYWSLVALLVAILLICLVGRYARHFFGKRILQLVDAALLRVPLLNKIYGTIKQVNDAFANNKSSFKEVVLVRFPHNHCQSVAFITGEQKCIPSQSDKKMFSVFVPTTPNPTSGFLIFVAEDQITRLNISVPDGIKLIISAGSVSPDVAAPEAIQEIVSNRSPKAPSE